MRVSVMSSGVVLILLLKIPETDSLFFRRFFGLGSKKGVVRTPSMDSIVLPGTRTPGAHGPVPRKYDKTERILNEGNYNSGSLGPKFGRFSELPKGPEAYHTHAGPARKPKRDYYSKAEYNLVRRNHRKQKSLGVDKTVKKYEKLRAEAADMYNERVHPINHKLDRWKGKLSDAEAQYKRTLSDNSVPDSQLSYGEKLRRGAADVAHKTSIPGASLFAAKPLAQNKNLGLLQMKIDKYKKKIPVLEQSLQQYDRPYQTYLGKLESREARRMAQHAQKTRKYLKKDIENYRADQMKYDAAHTPAKFPEKALKEGLERNDMNRLPNYLLNKDVVGPKVKLGPLQLPHRPAYDQYSKTYVPWSGLSRKRRSVNAEEVIAAIMSSEKNMMTAN